MKLLFFQWNAYMQKDIAHYFDRNHIDYDIISYNFRTSEHDDFCERKLPPIIKSGNFDFVFSLNFLPFLADICHSLNVRYLSWTYDSPINFTRLDALRYPQNYAFFFDRNECQRLWSQGFDRVFHLPLGMDVEKMDSLIISDEDRERFCSDITFIGKIYESDIDTLLQYLPDYDKGYLTGICHAQQRVYGYNFIYDILL